MIDDDVTRAIIPIGMIDHQELFHNYMYDTVRKNISQGLDKNLMARDKNRLRAWPLIDPDSSWFTIFAKNRWFLVILAKTVRTSV